MKDAKDRPLHEKIADEVMQLLDERNTGTSYDLHRVRSATGTVMNRRKIFEEETRYNLLGKVVPRIRKEISARNKMAAANDARRASLVDMSYFYSVRFIRDQREMNMFSNPID